MKISVQIKARDEDAAPLHRFFIVGIYDFYPFPYRQNIPISPSFDI